MATERRPHAQRLPRRVAQLMAFESAALATMAGLHLTGTLAGGANQAGVPEAIICVVLAFGAAALMRKPPHPQIALATVAFSILGFLVGLTFTLQGGHAIDLAFHLAMLPVLIFTLLVLRRRPPGSAGIHVAPERR